MCTCLRAGPPNRCIQVDAVVEASLGQLAPGELAARQARQQDWEAGGQEVVQLWSKLLRSKAAGAGAARAPADGQQQGTEAGLQQARQQVAAGASGAFAVLLNGSRRQAGAGRGRGRGGAGGSGRGVLRGQVAAQQATFGNYMSLITSQARQG
jgi:hypothetical protein